MFRQFVPKSYIYLRSGYNLSLFWKDLLAGITVGIIALPLAIAFAIASGVSPERGLITAVVAGFLISILGGSRIQIGGPTGAFVVIIYDIIQRSGYQGLALSTLMAALFLVLFGLFRLGTWIKYIPYPLIIGFTSGIALIIFSSQIKDFFGLNMGVPPAQFVEKWSSYISVFSTVHFPTLFLAVGTLVMILLIRRFIPRLPWGICAIVVSTLITYIFNLPVETIYSKYGEISSKIPFPSLPSFIPFVGHFNELVMDAITIAFLAGIESLLSAVVGDGMMGTHHKSNCELVAQGIANFASILFGGIPATGAVARTAANAKLGAQTPVAGMIHSIVLLFIILFLSPLVSQIPLASLSAILIMVSWNMSEIDHITRLFKAPSGDIAIFVITFLLTVFVDITIAIPFGMILSSFLFMKKMSQYSKTHQLTSLLTEPNSEFPERLDPEAIMNKKIPEGVEVYEIQGPFFFGAADMLQGILLDFKKATKVFILRMRYVPFIDASGMQGLNEFYRACQKSKTDLILSGIHGQTKKDLDNFEFTKLIGEDHMFSQINLALKKAEQIINQ